MKNNEEDIFSQNSSQKTETSSFNDDTYFQEVNNPLFPKMRPRIGGKTQTNNKLPGRNTVYVPASKVNENNKNSHSKFLFFGKGKSKVSNDNNDNNNITNKKMYDTKKLKNKKLSKTNTINYFSPANEFQKTTLEKNNLIEDNNSEINFGISLKPLEEQWKFQKILLDYNILDFTSK
jgi:hypothetical protein